MDIKQLTTFVTFAKEGTYIRTSMKLNYAVSTLTEHIGSLEQEMGVKLVESHGKRTTLTKNGEIFLRYAEKILQEYQSACERMHHLSAAGGSLRVMATESLGLYRLAPVLSEFTRAYPQIEMSVSLEQPVAPFDKLRQHKGDVFFCYGLGLMDSAEFVAERIFQEPLVLFAYPQHPLAMKKQVLPQDLRYEQFILPGCECFYRDAVSACLRRSGVEMQVRMTLDSSSLIKEYVKLRHGISILPHSVVREDIRRGDLVLLRWAGESFFGIAQAVTLKKEWVDPGLRALVEFAKRTARTEEAPAPCTSGDG